jgi:hypothetical protein
MSRCEPFIEQTDAAPVDLVVTARFEDRFKFAEALPF